MNIFKTTTGNIQSILGMYASLTLRQAAEKVVDEKVASYRDLVTKAVYSEAEKIVLNFEKEMFTASEKTGIRIIIDDRREKNE